MGLREKLQQEDDRTIKAKCPRSYFANEQSAFVMGYIACRNQVLAGLDEVTQQIQEKTIICFAVNGDEIEMLDPKEVLALLDGKKENK